MQYQKLFKHKILVGKILTIQHPFVKFVRLFHSHSFPLYGIVCIYTDMRVYVCVYTCVCAYVKDTITVTEGMYTYHVMKFNNDMT